MAKYKITLEEVSSKRRIEAIEEYPDNCHENFAEWYWTDGNMGCDCNKYKYFYPLLRNVHPCGDTEFKTISVERIDEIQ